MRDMGKEGAPRLEFLHHAERVGHCGMRRMRLVAQCVEEKNVEPVQPFHGLRRYLAEVRKVSGRPKTEPVNLRIAVQHHDRLKICAKQLQGAIDGNNLHPGNAAVFVVSFKNVAENPLRSEEHTSELQS